MKLLEFEAKEVFGREGIRIPKGVVVRKGEDLPPTWRRSGTGSSSRRRWTSAAAVRPAAS